MGAAGAAWRRCGTWRGPLSAGCAEAGTATAQASAAATSRAMKDYMTTPSEDEQIHVSTVGPGQRAHICRTAYSGAPRRRIRHAAGYSDGGIARLEPRL